MAKKKLHKKIVKNMHDASKDINIFLAGLAFILSFVIIFSGQNKKSDVNGTINIPETKVEISTIPQPTENIYEKVENGVYTNYKYGFSLEYPEDIFTNYINLSPSGGSVPLFNEIKFYNKDNLELGNYTMTVAVTPKNIIGLSKNNSSTGTHTMLILKKATLGNYYAQIVRSYLLPSATDIEGHTSDGIEIQLDEVIIHIQILSSNSKSVVDQRLRYINDIFRSIMFLDSEYSQINP